MKRWHVISHLIKKFQLKKIVEIGLWKGATARHVLSERGDLEYVGVDAYRVQPNNESETYETGENGHEWNHSKMIADMESFESNTPNFTFMHMMSAEASKKFDDASIDLIFIDGDHSYEGCHGDIEAWWPKIRPGGIMMGHDYGPEWPGVLKAVDDFIRDNGSRIRDMGFREHDNIWVLEKL